LRVTKISEEFYDVLNEVRRSINASSVEITRAIANFFGEQIKQELIKRKKERIEKK